MLLDQDIKIFSRSLHGVCPGVKVVFADDSVCLAAEKKLMPWESTPVSSGFWLVNMGEHDPLIGWQGLLSECDAGQVKILF